MSVCVSPIITFVSIDRLSLNVVEMSCNYRSPYRHALKFRHSTWMISGLRCVPNCSHITYIHSSYAFVFSNTNKNCYKIDTYLYILPSNSLTFWMLKLIQMLYKIYILRHRKQIPSFIMIDNTLFLFRNIIALWPEDYTERINAHFGQRTL